ncbi:MAG: CdaR family protein [Armatimonadota bacterium]
MSVRKLLSNWPYKLLALGTAIILSSYVHSERNPWTTASLDMTVQAVHIQDGYVARPRQDKVTVSLRGSKSDVDAVVAMSKSGEAKAIIDLEGCQAGDHDIPVKIDIPGSTNGNITVQAVPQHMLVKVDVVSSRTMPLQVRIKTSPPIGLSASQPDISPATATVSGGSSLVNSVARLVVVVDPTPLKPSVDEYAAIKALDARGNEVQGVDVAPDDAHVAMTLVEAPANKAVFVSPSIVGQPEFPYKVTKVSVTPSSIMVNGKPERLAGTSIILTDDVDVSGATSDVIRYVGLHVPPGIDIEGTGKVKVTIRIVSEQTP